MVAVLALRLDRLHDLRFVHLSNRKDRSYLSHFISGRWPSFFRYLGIFVAGIQQGCYGLYLVRSPGMDRRYLNPSSTCGADDCSFNSGQCVTLMIRSIWTAYDDVPNSLPASAGTETKYFVSFFIFWACSLPAIWFPVQKIRHLFTVKAYFVPPAGIAFLIWALIRAKGIGPIVRQPAEKSGNALGWAMVQGIMSSIANFATLIVSKSFLEFEL